MIHTATDITLASKSLRHVKVPEEAASIAIRESLEHGNTDEGSAKILVLYTDVAGLMGLDIEDDLIRMAS